MLSLPKKFKVGVLSGNRLLREFLSKVIGKHSEVTCATISEFINVNKRMDVILIDAHDAKLAIVTQLVKQCADTKFLMMNADWDRLSIPECARLGITGFLLKDAAAGDVVSGIQGVHEGKVVIPIAIAEKLAGQLRNEQQGCAHYVVRDAELTAREREVFVLMIDGLTNKQIGSRLNLAEFTVKNHVHNILQKLDCRTRTELRLRVIRSHHGAA